MRILVVEDEHKIAASLKKGLEQENFIVDLAYDGVTGFDLASEETYDVLILDVMLPGMDGFTICKKLRSSGKHTPILMLTAKDQVDDKVLGLNTGADDYLSKPFAFNELVARVKALGRRPVQTNSTQVYTISDLVLDENSSTVKRQNTKLSLSKREFVLLSYLIKNPYKTFSKDQLINSLWSYDSDILPNTVEVYIGYLRNKVDKAFPNSPQLIKTIRGFGYQLSE